MLKVRVIANGFLDGRLYTPGDEINLDNKKKFCDKWMEKIKPGEGGEDNTPPAPPLGNDEKPK